MKPKAYLLVFDGFADWEPAHTFCEIRKSGKYEVVTAGFSRQEISSMAGLKISPDVTLEAALPSDAAFFMLPGGDMWQEASRAEIHPLLHRLHEEGVLIGAICAATLEIARAGLTRGIRHTSNAKSYLRSMVPDYQDGGSYVDDLAVTDRNIITASGLGSIEFAREVIRELRIHNEADTTMWFDMFKHGVMPAGTR
ncbi:MAG TPA: DJ-1/PfpI family protein [Candidatus Sulfotelmatobacter sp.]|jgi:putative intracellular protease/amidase|nr:DJ-1/PfpI family protein [Candidatus Sulfotelmatobacter sp.]